MGARRVTLPAPKTAAQRTDGEAILEAPVEGCHGSRGYCAGSNASYGQPPPLHFGPIRRGR